MFCFKYVKATLTSGIKSRLFNYSVFISKDLTIFAGKLQNGQFSKRFEERDMGFHTSE